MHVKTALTAILALGVASYVGGKYGHDLGLDVEITNAIPAALAQEPEAMRLLAALDGDRLAQVLPQPSFPAAGNPRPADKPRLTAPSAGPVPAPAPPAAPAPAPSPKVDESALRYFASQGDTRRLEAEIARLRALYPEWRPPDDLNAPSPDAGDAELDEMWKLFSQGKIGEARAAIAARSAADPAWQVPQDLLAQLDKSEAAQRLVNASDAKQWDQVLKIAAQTPGLLTCTNVDALWRVAEGFVQTTRLDRARDAYAYVLTNCTDAAERLATMQKALPLLPEDMIAALLRLEKGTEFGPVRDDLARRHVGKAAEDPKLTATPDEIARLDALARAASTPDDAILLGFYTLHHNEPAKAVDWFKLALSRNGGAKAAEGAVIALGAVKEYQEAESLGSAWLEAGPANRKAYLDVATALIAQTPPPRLDQPVVQRIAKTIGTDRYAPGAQGLGWYAYNSGQTAAAETWFETALSWDADQEPAAYGLGLSRQRLRDIAGLRAIVAKWGRRSPRIADLLNPRRTVEAAPDKREGAPAAALPATATSAPPVAAPAAAPAAPSTAAAVAPPLALGPARETVREARRIDEDEPAPRRALTVRVGGRERVLVAETAGLPPASGACRGGATGAAALARGWCLLNLKRPVEAAAAFDAAIRTSSGRVAEDAVSGKVYAQLQRGLTAEAGIAASTAPVSRKRRAELSAAILADRFYAAYDAKEYNRALITLQDRARYAPEGVDMMTLRGWSYFNLGRYDDARRVFEAVVRANGSAEARGGLAAIKDATRLHRY